MYDDEDHRDIETTQYHMEQVASHRNDETVDERPHGQMSKFQITQLGNCSARMYGGSRNYISKQCESPRLDSLINVKIIYREENKVRWPNLSFLLSLIIEALAAG